MWCEIAKTLSCTQASQKHFIDRGDNTELNLISELKFYLERNILKHVKQTA